MLGGWRIRDWGLSTSPRPSPLEEGEHRSGRGRSAGDGRIDILAKYGGEYLGIVEIKLEEINETSLAQLEDYLRVRHQILLIGDYWSEGSEPKWVGLLVGSSISPSLQAKLSSRYQFEGIPIAGMTIRRFRSEKSEIFVISDTFFKFFYTQKDYSKFIFQGKEFNKGKLVHAVISAHVERKPDITFSELKRDFPDSIQGSSLGVFDLTASAEEIFQRWRHKRHYIKEDEIIKLQDQSISTSTQWNPKNINEFIKQANKLGWKIELK
ncbi:hypothetical protein C943_02313 [Mariniradius saccharolyticus AK6]|uniref:DUF91 domain-containing protein n=1 Tax=Mariniradius saccharolyticus AK6 TaxID=1239962 RepID=M7Y1S7_9BACT|nr:hypothetical protein C943_02313 [Mariniradius saccharolyticus AK6]